MEQSAAAVARLETTISCIVQRLMEFEYRASGYVTAHHPLLQAHSMCNVFEGFVLHAVKSEGFLVFHGEFGNDAAQECQFFVCCLPLIFPNVPMSWTMIVRINHDPNAAESENRGHAASQPKRG